MLCCTKLSVLLSQLKRKVFVMTMTIEQMIDIWENRREIKNLMGRYTYAFFYKREETIYDAFWSKRADTSLGVNDGWYLGDESIRGYYDYFVCVNAMADSIKKERFPALLKDRKPEELRAMGNMEVKSISEGVIEIAEDGKTAKCTFSYCGNMSQMTDVGPVSYWTNGEYCADLVKEDDEWKIWHLLNPEDAHKQMGEKWWGPVKSLNPFPEFAPIAGIQKPEPTVSEILYENYSTQRTFKKMPEIPAPYKTFSETFSYGYEKENVV